MQFHSFISVVAAFLSRHRVLFIFYYYYYYCPFYISLGERDTLDNEDDGTRGSREVQLIHKK